MIRVVTEGPPVEGLYKYRIEWRRRFVGLSATPLIDACALLSRTGVMDNAVVGLFREGEEELIDRTTIGQGVKAMPYREFPGGPLKPSPSDLKPATPTAQPPPPSTPPAPPAGKDQLFVTPKKSVQSHHKRKPIASGGRRGSSR
jgi:hypothetical protein